MKNIAKIIGSGLLLVSVSGVQADQVILDDLIVDGSICAGQDCVNGESFGFDTLRLKENNLRIKAQDTSSTASFPTQDWQITFNDSSNGGQNKYSIDAISPVSSTPFTIEAGSNSHALYVDDGGRIGFGTSTPVADLHVKSGNTPTLRLEQDGTSGFSPQTWDLAGNEANFFLRDASNGSTLPFRVFPAAPSNSLTIEATTGDIGMGTTSPAAKLHIVDTSGSGAEDMLVLENNGNPELVLKHTINNNEWVMSGGLNYVIKGGVGGIDTTLSTLTATGDLTIIGALTTMGNVCDIGTEPTGCDLVFHPETQLPSIEEHAALMWSNSYLPAVGPTPENMPFNLTEKTGGMLNELEKAHIYIEQLHNRLAKLEAEQQELKQIVTSLVRKNEDGVLLTSLN